MHVYTYTYINMYICIYMYSSRIYIFMYVYREFTCIHNEIRGKSRPKEVKLLSCYIEHHGSPY